MKEHTLQINYGTSRGRETYGYGTAALYEHGKRVASCNGGGYDFRGTVFARWLCLNYRERLDWLELEAPDAEGRIYSRRHYGVTQYPVKGKPVRTVDGACGFDSVRRVAEAIGLAVRLVSAGRNRDIILVSETWEG